MRAVTFFGWGANISRNVIVPVDEPSTLNRLRIIHLKPGVLGRTLEAAQSY